MRNTTRGLVAAMLLLSTSLGAPAAEADTNGITPGKWTMDLDAAKKLAKEKKLPILLNFSGSDWCGWCKLMQETVFSQQRWKDYAKDNVAMVIIDFPQDAGIVPQKYVARNNELKEKYGVEGFPTFVVLDDDAETVLGTMGAGQNKTPETFTAELRALLRYRPVEVAKYAKTLSPEEKLAYLKIVDQMTECRKAIKDQEQQIAAAQKKIEDLQKKDSDLSDAAREFRAAKLDAGKLKQYKELKAKLDEAKKKLSDWLKTEPERNSENEQKYRTMTSDFQEIMGKLSEF